MTALKVSKPLTEGAPKAAARLEAATASARASVAETAQTLGDYLRDQRRGAQLTLRQLADHELSERQKQVLLEIYASFRHGNRATDPTDPTNPTDPRDTADGDGVS